MIIKNLNINYGIGFITISSLIVGFLTIQTFAGKGIIQLTSLNIQILLIVNLLFLTIFFSFVFYKFFKIYNERNKQNIIGLKTKNKFFFYFISLAGIPSILVAIFSLLIFNFSIEKWFDKKINDVVENSVQVAQKYLDEHQASIGKDILLIANDFNRNSATLVSDKNNFENYIELQSKARSVNNIYVVTEKGDLVFSTPKYNKTDYIKPDSYILLAAKSGKPIIISSAYTNKTYGMVKLLNFDNLFLYVVQNVDPKIVNNLKITGDASTYYYDIKNNIFSLQITFMVIYIIITLILIFLAGIISINLSSYATSPFLSLLNVSNEIKKGNYNVILEEKNLDSDFNLLYSTFNNMLARIKEDQIKISLSGRYEAWNIIARKLAHEIKNPLTPIQLSLDRIKDKFSNQLTKDQDQFEQHISLINFQIKEINSLLNSFSDFARMPEPVFEICNIFEIIDSAASPYRSNYLNINFSIVNKLVNQHIRCDRNQIFRLFTNLVKNSVESIIEKNSKNENGKIFINIFDDVEYVFFEVIDNGIGFDIVNKGSMTEPYFTTKSNGSGLGLSIVLKIIHEHGGNINFYDNDSGGAKIVFTIKK